MNQTCYIVIGSYGQPTTLHSSLTRARSAAAAGRAEIARYYHSRFAAAHRMPIETRTVRDMAVHARIPSTKAWSIEL